MNRSSQTGTWRPLDDIVLAHAQTAPGKTAIKFEQYSLSYQQLANKVNGLSKVLVDAGVKPGDYVAVLLEPSINITVVLLSVIRVGAVYAPLDPEHPESQLKARYADMHPAVTVCDTAMAERVGGWAPETINIDQADTALQGLPHLPERTPEAPACVFFTSGTTGMAKGVVGNLGALTQSIVEPSAELNFTCDDTLNSIARYAWSISMLELLAPLVAGGCSLILDRKKALDLAWVKAQTETCTCLHLPPALLRNYANFLKDNSQVMPRLRLVWYGGDVFHPSHIESLKKVFPAAKIGTAYGCTEIFGLSHIHIYDDNKAVNKVLIGKPVQGMTQKVVDTSGNVVGPGAQGELWLGGKRVTMGYLCNTQLNAEKFIHSAGERYFKTGDFVDVQSDGALVFLQRKDKQVKIRGIRIELGEIEHHLNALSEISEAVVLALANETDDLELNAYVMLEPGVRVTTAQLKDKLAGDLPEYMLPAKLFLLDKLPVTENFKIDKKALAELVLDESENLANVDMPAEALPLAELWAELTGQMPRSVEDNFFQAGGNSLLAMQLVLHINKRFSASVDVAEVYRNPTLVGQLALLPTVKPLQQPVSVSDGDEPLHATQVQVGLFFRELLDARGVSITCTRYIRSPAAYQDETVREALKVLLDRYPTLRTNLKISRPNIQLQVNEYPQDDIQVIRKPEVFSLAKNAHNELNKHQYKFNLKNGPLVCAIISPLTCGAEVLQLTCHHIAADDNSMGRLAREFVEIYSAKRNAMPMPTVQALAVNYEDFAREQFQRVQAGEYNSRCAELGAMLLECLASSKNQALLDLRAWDKRSALETEVALAKQTASDVSFVEAVAALSWSCYRIFGRDSFVFCAHVALRRDSIDQPVVGMFVNLVPVLTGVDSRHNFSQHVQRTQRDLDDAMARSDLPYELVLSSQPELKKIRKYPFDAFINELIFATKLGQGYENLSVPNNLATDGSEINMSLIQHNDGQALQLACPNIASMDTKLSVLAEKIAKTLSR